MSVSAACSVQFVRVWDQIEPSIYSVEGLQRGDGDGGIDISEDKSNHLLIKPSTSRLLFSVGQGAPLTLTSYIWTWQPRCWWRQCIVQVEGALLTSFHLLIRHVWPHISLCATVSKGEFIFTSVYCLMTLAVNSVSIYWLLFPIFNWVVYHPLNWWL